MRVLAEEGFVANACITPVALEISRWIGAYVRLDLVGDDGWLVDEVKSWCFQHLTNHAEKLTSRPEAPLVIYFVSEAEQNQFVRCWGENDA